jgi:hypothetical protein
MRSDFWKHAPVRGQRLRGIGPITPHKSAWHYNSTITWVKIQGFMGVYRS